MRTEGGTPQLTVLYLPQLRLVREAQLGIPNFFTGSRGFRDGEPITANKKSERKKEKHE